MLVVGCYYRWQLDDYKDVHGVSSQGCALISNIYHITRSVQGARGRVEPCNGWK